MSESHKDKAVQNYYEDIIAMLPGHIYWKNLNGQYLGCNDAQARALKLRSRHEIVHYKPYTCSTPAERAIAETNDRKVVAEGVVVTGEEPMTFDGEMRVFLSQKSPIRNENGEIVGVLGVSTDITARKEAERLQLEKAVQQQADKMQVYYENIIAMLPGHIYWKNLNGQYIGCNDEQAKTLKLASRHEISKYVPYTSLTAKERATAEGNDHRVIIEGAMVTSEESMTLDTGEVRTFLSQKSPIKNAKGEVTGILGVSTDITAHKEAERLKFENEFQKQALELQGKLAKIAAQVAHDIKSPLASLDMLMKSVDGLSEDKRLTLKRIAKSIDSIAAHLLNQYSAEKVAEGALGEPQEVLLLSPWLQQIITDKELQYQKLPIEFALEIPNSKIFECLRVQRVALTRTLSNLINNAVDAMRDQVDTAHHKVTVSLEADLEYVRLKIKDTGKGMSEDVVKKILAEVAFTQGKSEGHGIGLTQVRETLKANEGRLSIDSQEGVGTTIILTFPTCEKPQWLGYELHLKSNDHLVILDDDPSIHDVWDARFKGLVMQYPSLEIQHFTAGLEALHFLKSQTQDKKSRIFLLTDYELLKQTLTGLDVIAESGLSRALLVTSYYGSPDIQGKIMRIGAKILPKQLAPEIVIHVKHPTSEVKPIDIIFLEDDALYASMVIPDVFCDLEVKHYLTPEAFLRELPTLSLPLTVPISIDKNFAQSKMDGLRLAAKLHEMGFFRLYLCSGEKFKAEDLPGYLTVLEKHELRKIFEG